jgi:type I restriction enzyme S subunit
MTPEDDETYNLVELDDIQKDAGGIINVQKKEGSDIGSNKREFTDEHILYCKLRPYLNKVVKPDFSGIATSELLVFEPKKDITYEYLYQFLSSPTVRDQAEFIMKGANQPRVSKGELLDFNIPVPPLDEQEQIVEAVEERLERVEQLEKSVENVGRLADEYDESLVLSLMSGGVKEQPSVPPKNSNVPEEWEVVNIKDVSQVETGGTPKTGVDEYWDGDITWIRVSDMPESMYVSDSEDKITETGLREGSCSLIPEGGVILSTRATIGEVAIADEEMATNQGFKSIIPESKLESKYLAYYLDSTTEYLKSLGKGATYDEVNKSQVQNIKVPLPPRKKQNEIIDKIESFDSERLRVAVESVGDLFNEYRDSVLSHAFQNKINY